MADDNAWILPLKRLRIPLKKGHMLCHASDGGFRLEEDAELNGLEYFRSGYVQNLYDHDTLIALLQELARRYQIHTGDPIDWYRNLEGTAWVIINTVTKNSRWAGYKTWAATEADPRVALVKAFQTWQPLPREPDVISAPTTETAECDDTWWMTNHRRVQVPIRAGDKLCSVASGSIRVKKEPADGGKAYRQDGWYQDLYDPATFQTSARELAKLCGMGHPDADMTWSQQAGSGVWILKNQRTGFEMWFGQKTWGPSIKDPKVALTTALLEKKGMTKT